MSTIRLIHITSRGAKYYPPITDVNITCAFGSVQLVTEPEKAETLLSLIKDILEPEQGQIQKDDRPYTVQERTKDSWFVRQSVVKIRWFTWRAPDTQSQIRYGLAHTPNPRYRSEAEVIDRFHLSPERITRPIKWLSSEAWRASCAIGLVNGKTVFCFPYIPAGYIERYYSVWFRELIDILRSFHTLVLLPTEVTPVTQQLCDAVVEL